MLMPPYICIYLFAKLTVFNSNILHETKIDLVRLSKIGGYSEIIDHIQTKISITQFVLVIIHSDYNYTLINLILKWLALRTVKKLLYVIQFYIIMFTFLTTISIIFKLSEELERCLKIIIHLNFEFHGSVLKYRSSQIQ